MRLAFRGAGAKALAVVPAMVLQACVSHPPPLPGHVYSGDRKSVV